MNEGDQASQRAAKSSLIEQRRNMGYVRLVRRYDSTDDKESERTKLLVLLASIPGISEVVLHGEHLKGGYRVGCTIEKDVFDRVLSTIEGAGWMFAI